MRDLPHDRESQVAAGNDGKHDRWLVEKQSHHKEYADMPLALGYYDRKDIPFYYSFADAFTICDQHFCSAQTCTSPNRLYLWTGTCRDPRDPSLIARLSNGQIDHDSHADWLTFPERLEMKGIPWKIYQNEIDLETGLNPEEADWLGNFGDNPMEYFSQYRVGFHPARRRHLEKEIAAIESAIASISSQTADEELTGPDGELTTPPPSLVKIRDKLALLQEELSRSSTANFDALAPYDQRLHRNAFTTNTLDSAHRQLTALHYRDGDEDREVPAPAGDILHQFRNDTNEGRLPTVSWLVAPANFSDHPGVPWYGAWYVSEVMDILTHNPEVWKKTILILTYDENDGYFDHIPPFVPPMSGRAGTGSASEGIDTRSEFDEHGHPIGLGYRVPLIIASPWTRGGHVCSQVFDHTSILRFLEVFLSAKTNDHIEEGNISKWRRTICGDLTSAFQSAPINSKPSARLHRDPFITSIHKAKFKEVPNRFRSFNPEEIAEICGSPIPTRLLAQQEKGQRPSCALPYELHAEGYLNRANRSFEITFSAGNKAFGKKSAGAPFQVYAPGKYAGNDDPSSCETPLPPEEARRWSFAVAAGDNVPYSWKVDEFENHLYYLRTYGPNGFFREYRGSLDDPELEIEFVPETAPFRVPTGSVILKAKNTNPLIPLELVIRDLGYGKPTVRLTVASGGSIESILELRSSHRWYDFQVTVDSHNQFSRRYAGRIETGKMGYSDPMIGREPIPADP